MTGGGEQCWMVGSKLVPGVQGPGTSISSSRETLFFFIVHIELPCTV